MNYKLILGDSRNMQLENNSVHLVVTSPPYPEFEMWNELFASLNCISFEDKHKYLDGIWKECHRVLIDGGLLCINIADASNAFNGIYKLYNNHGRIMQYCESIGFNCHPYIIWHKLCHDNRCAFVGSGMLPPNAYVAQECEFILIFRKGNIRKFKAKDTNRVASKYEMMERNQWFSQIWDMPGESQIFDGKRLGVFPYVIPYRLIRMFSVLGDIVLDPFSGTATTVRAAVDCGRTGVGYEINPEVMQYAYKRMATKQLTFINKNLVEITTEKKPKKRWV